MYWQKKWKQPDKDQKVKEEMLAIRKENPDYGYRRIYGELRNRNYLINRKKVQRLCQLLGIQVLGYKKKYRRYSSYKGVIGNLAPNRLNRRFSSSIAYQKITTDTTEMKYYEEDASGKLQIKKLYLDPYMDLFNLEIVSFQVTHQPNGPSMIEGLKEAIEKTDSCQFRRSFHSDRGWAYQMKEYQALLKKKGIFQSMLRKGNCYDNAPIENFFSVMKREMYYGKVYKSFEELKKSIERYIYYYNHERIKERFDYMSPVTYRKKKFAA